MYELKKEFFDIPNLDSFEVMHKVMNNRTYSISDFIQLCSKKPELKHLECQYDEQRQILTVRTRTFTFTYFAESWAMDWEVDQEVCELIHLKMSNWLRQPRTPNLFHPIRLAELDDNLFFRYNSRLQLKQWRESEQFEEDCQLLREMIDYIEDEAPAYLTTFNANLSLLNIIFDGNDKLRIGMVEQYTPKEMMSLPTYPRESWEEGIHNALEVQRNSYLQKVQGIHEAYEQMVQELKTAMSMKTPINNANALSLFRCCTTCYSYTDILLCELLGGSIPPREVGYWYSKGLLWGSSRSVEEVKEDIKQYTKVRDYSIKGIRFFADLEYCSLEYEEATPSIVLTLHKDVQELLELPPTIEAQAENEDGVGLDIYRIQLIESTLESAMKEYPKALELRCQPMHKEMLSIVQSIIDTCGPLLLFLQSNPESQTNYYFHFFVQEDYSVLINIVSKNGSEYEKTFTPDDFTSKLRVWWHSIMIKEMKELKDISLHPEQMIHERTEDLPF